LIRATALVAEGLSEERLLPSLARCAAEAAGAELAAVYVQPNPYASGLPAWRLGGHYGGDPEVLAALPRSYGEGGGVLAPLFQSAREVCEPDLLGVSGDDADGAVPPKQFPIRSLAGLPVRRRDSRPVGVLLLGALRRDAFDDASLSVMRAMGHLVGIGMDKPKPDLGRYVVTENEEDKGAFKTPTLREIDRTGPYMHDGRFRTLEDVIEHYDKGGIKNPYLDRRLKPLHLTAQDKTDLVAFLKALNGEGWQHVREPKEYP
jgi:hypothetical protein